MNSANDMVEKWVTRRRFEKNTKENGSLEEKNSLEIRQTPLLFLAGGVFGCRLVNP